MSAAGSRRPRALLLLAVSLGAAAVLAAPGLPFGAAAAQVPDAEDAAAPGWAVTSWGGFSMRQNPGDFSFTDVVHGGVRVEMGRDGAWPWVQVDRFVRPDLVCVEGFLCNDDGWQLRAGLTLPASSNPSEEGLHSAVALGAGVGTVEERSVFTYLLGLGIHYSVTAHLAPRAEVRWERYPGISNIVIVALGLRLAF